MRKTREEDNRNFINATTLRVDRAGTRLCLLSALLHNKDRDTSQDKDGKTYQGGPRLIKNNFVSHGNRQNTLFWHGLDLGVDFVSELICKFRKLTPYLKALVLELRKSRYVEQCMYQS